MKLSLRINGTDESDSDSSNTTTDYPNYEKAGKILERELEKIYPASKNFEFAEISLSFVNPSEIRELNKTYRDTDEATDVLSFPLMENEPAGRKPATLVGLPELPVLALGDIVICPEEVKRLHPELNLHEGISLMIAHSFLHLLGFDHATEEDEKIMWARQDEIAKKIMEACE